MSDPNYQEFPAEAIPLERREEGSEARVIAGTTSSGTRGPVVGVPTDPLYLDVSLGSNGLFGEPIPATHNAFVYVLQGEVSIWGAQSVAPPVPAGTLAVLGAGDRVAVSGGEARNRFLLIAGRRLSEPVARGGPFVMNTRAELLQAFRDFEEGRF
jgi:redox-sensitive bicupin YhaK (pirin superfamily)